MVDTYDAPLVVADGEGRRYINRERLGENYFAVRLDNYPLAVPASGTVMSAFSIPEDAGHAGDFEAVGLVANSTVPFTLQLSEVGVQANAFTSGPIHHNLIAGTGRYPFVFAESIFLLAGRQVQATVTDLSTTLAGSVRLALIGRKFNNDMDLAVREKRAQYLANRPTRAFWLSLDNNSIDIAAGSVNNEAFMTMPSGSHFSADDVMASSSGIFEVAIFDGQAGRQLTYGAQNNGFIDSRMITGPGGLPARLFGSPIIQPRRTIRILLNDLANNGTNRVFFTFHGRRLRLPVG